MSVGISALTENVYAVGGPESDENQQPIPYPAKSPTSSDDSSYDIFSVLSFPPDIIAQVEENRGIIHPDSTSGTESLDAKALAKFLQEVGQKKVIELLQQEIKFQRQLESNPRSENRKRPKRKKPEDISGEKWRHKTDKKKR